jgi:hypothetical protein
MLLWPAASNAREGRNASDPPAIVTPQVLAIELQQIEGNEEDLRVMAAVPQLVKTRYPPLVAAHCLAVDQATAHLQSPHSLEDERVAGRPVMPVPGQMPTLAESRRGMRR